MRIVFMGTAELACASLRALCETPDMEVVLVVTQPDRPKGRHMKLQPPPVKQTAMQLGLEIYQPEKARSPECLERLRQAAPDVIVVVAYGQILPQTVLDLPAHGCVNVHASLLPKYRGAAPIQWAILEGETETGVTIMQMDAGLDTGPILTQRRTPILPEDDAQTLHDRLAELGATLLVETLPDYVAGRIQPQPQPAEGASYARKITRQDGLIDWRKPAVALANQVRAFTPWPGSYTFLSEPRGRTMLKVWKAEAAPSPSTPTEPGRILTAERTGITVACGEGSLCLTELQREGGKRLTAEAFLAGCPLHPGQKLGTD